MEFIRESRRGWIYRTEAKEIDIDNDGVLFEDGIVRFSKSKFENQTECDRWVEDKLNDNVIYHKPFSGPTKALEISERDWEAIQGLMRTPSKFARKDVRIYEDWLCHNLPDREIERFMPDALIRFSETILGKQRLVGHNWSISGYGRYYKSQIIRMSAEEALERFGKSYPSKNAKKLFDRISKIDGSVIWLVASFYIPSVSIDSRSLDMGIGGDSSIGFTGVERKQYDEDGFRWVEIHPRDNCEALEGSDVGVPAQPGAGAKTLSKESAVGDESAQVANTDFDGGKTMEFEVAAFDIKMPITSDDFESETKALMEAVNNGANQMAETIQAITDENEGLKALKADIEALVGDTDPVASVKGLVEKSAQADELYKYKQYYVSRIIKCGLIGKMFDQKDVADREKLYLGKDMSELSILLADAERLADAVATPVIQGNNTPSAQVSSPAGFYPVGANRL